MPTIRSFVQQNIDSLRKMSPALRNETICKAAQCGSERARRVYREECIREHADQPVRHKVSLSREDMLQTHDGETKAVMAINAALSRLTDELIYRERDFRILFCKNVQATVFKKAAIRFPQNRFRIGAQIFWSTADTKEWALQTFAKACDV
jgi:chromosome condensin MukBEF ATPase and DNA-binding subunit MukB